MRAVRERSKRKRRRGGPRVGERGSGPGEGKGVGESGPPSWVDWCLGLSPVGVSISFFFSISNSTQV